MVRIQKIIFTLILLALASGSLSARRANMKFYTIKHGLQNNQARQVVCLPDGRIMVTVEGMFEWFDGSLFHAIKVDQQQTCRIENFFSQKHYNDRHGRLWVTDYYRIYAFDQKTLKQISVPGLLKESGIPIKQLMNFFIDNDGDAWISTSEGEVWSYNWKQKAKRVTQLPPMTDGNPCQLTDVVQVGKEVFLLQQNGHATCYDKTSMTRRWDLPINNGEKGHRLKALTWDKDHFIVRADQGLFLYNIRTRTTSIILADNNINDFCRDHNGGLWVSCRFGRLWHLDRNLHVIDNIDEAMDTRTNKIIQGDWVGIGIDWQGSLWACKQNDGIGYMSTHRRAITHHTIIDSTHNVKNLLNYHNTIYAATTNGVFRQTADKQAWEPVIDGLKQEVCNTLATDSKDRIWISCGNGSVTCFEPQTEKTDIYGSHNVQGMWENVQFCQPYSNSNKLLVCVRSNDIATLDPDSWQLMRTIEKFPELKHLRHIVTACQMKDGFLVGSQNGFVWFDKQSGAVDMNATEALNNNPNSDKCNCIFKDSRGRVWIGSQNGLMEVERIKGKWAVRRNISEKDGLPNSCVISMVEDKDKNIWIATYTGISRMDEEKDGNVSFVSLRDGDGMDEPNLMERSACMTSDGKLLFGSRFGYYEVDPTKITEQTASMTPVLLDFLVCDTIGGLAPDELRYDQNRLRFTVSVLNYAYPQQVLYRYRLHNSQNKQWATADGKDGCIHIDYNQLPHGSYNLEVQAAIQGHEWGEPLLIAIHITPPWWKNWWAYCIYVILVVVSASYLVHAYIKAKNRRLNLERTNRTQMEREQLNEERLRFFTNITHELRTPLTLIMGPLEDLVEDKELPERLHKRMVSINGSAQRLLQMVNQLLEFRKAETKNRKLNKRMHQLDNLVLEIFLHFEEMNRNPNVQFRRNVEHSGMLLNFDSEAVEIILTNLLSNAVKYTPQGSITMTLANEGGDIVLKVKDTGYGISSKALPHIFDRYYQAKDEHQASGTGIGLSLAKTLADLHGASLEVESRKDVGTEFTLRFHRRDLEKLHDSSEDVTIPETAGNAETSSEEMNDTQNANNERTIVLIVEDNDEIRQYVTESLEEYTVLQATNGREGAEMALAHTPDFIITDLMMPEMDGIAMCRMLKSDIRTSHIPVIMLTAKDSLSDQEEGYESGADAYITKPFTARILRSLLSNQIEQRKRLTAILTQQEYHLPEEDNGSGDSQPAPEGEPAPALSAKDQNFMNELNSIINENIGNTELDTNFLAKHLLMSRTSLFRKMKALLGMGANEYIRRIRLYKAKEMLTSQDMTKRNIAGIAYDCGFTSLSHFRTCFKAEFGTTPSELSGKKTDEND